MFDDDFKKRVSDAAGDILIKKGKEYFDNPSAFDWGSAGVAVLAGAIGGVFGSMLYEKSQMNKSTASLGQLSFQIQQMTNELNTLKSSQYQPPFNSTLNGNTAAGINLNNTNNNQPPTFDEFGNKIS